MGKAIGNGCLPSGKGLHNCGKSPFFMGKFHYKWQFLVAMLNYQRVIVVNIVVKNDDKFL